MSALSIAIVLLAVNFLTFLVFWWDKEAARAGEWRVRESTLLGLSLFGGSLGAITAQWLLRHKTRKEPFRTALPVIAALHLALGLALIATPDLVFGLLQLPGIDGGRPVF